MTVDRDKGRYRITVNRVSVYGRLRKILEYPPATFRMSYFFCVCGPPCRRSPTRICGPPSRRSPALFAGFPPFSPESYRSLSVVSPVAGVSPPIYHWSPQLPETVVPCVRSIGEFVQPVDNNLLQPVTRLQGYAPTTITLTPSTSRTLNPKPSIYCLYLIFSMLNS